MDQNLRMDIVSRRGEAFGTRRTRNTKTRLSSPGVSHANPQAQAHLRGDSGDYHEPTVSASEARMHHCCYARPGHMSFDDTITTNLLLSREEALGGSG